MPSLSLDHPARLVMYAQLYGRKPIETDPLLRVLEVAATEVASRRLPVCPLVLGVGELPRLANEEVAKRRKRRRTSPPQRNSEPQRLQYISSVAASAIISEVLAPWQGANPGANITTNEGIKEERKRKVVFDNGVRSIAVVQDQVFSFRERKPC